MDEVQSAPFPSAVDASDAVFTSTIEASDAVVAALTLSPSPSPSAASDSDVAPSPSPASADLASADPASADSASADLASADNDLASNDLADREHGEATALLSALASQASNASADLEVLSLEPSLRRLLVALHQVNVNVLAASAHYRTDFRAHVLHLEQRLKTSAASASASASASDSDADSDATLDAASEAHASDFHAVWAHFPCGLEFGR